MNNVNRLRDEIDAIDSQRKRDQDRQDSDQERLQKVEEKITKLYKKYNPSKLPEVNDLMIKYKGKEEVLLQAIQKKYCTTGSSNRPWQYVLKHYDTDDNAMKRKAANWKIDGSLETIKSELDKLASSIGGECVHTVGKNGNRMLVVRKAAATKKANYGNRGNRNTHNRNSIKPTVENMRSMVHKRYTYIRHTINKSQLFTNEHDKRKEEKRIDQSRKQMRR